MQLKGLVKFFTAALILFSLWRLSFTFVAHNVDKKHRAYAENMVNKTAPELKGLDRDVFVEKELQHINDSLGNSTVYNFLGLSKYTYREVKAKELQLGLDLQGGMSVTLEVGVDELVASMSNNPKDINLTKAIEQANKAKANSDADFVKLFGEAYNTIVPNGKLANLFTKASQTKITPLSTNDEVLKVIREEAKAAINRTYNVLTKRIDKFGVAQPAITLDENKGIITVELAGVKNPESVRNILQATAKLQFWEVADINEVGNGLVKADELLKSAVKEASPASDTAVVAKVDTTKAVDTSSLASLIGNDNNATAAKEQQGGLLSVMQLVPGGAPYIGVVAKKDVERLKKYLASEEVKNQLPSNIKFLMGDFPSAKKANSINERDTLGVYAIKTVDGSDNARLEGNHVKSSKFDYQNGKAEISLEMDQVGTTLWANLTGANVGRPIAITLDDYVYSAPNVNEKIAGGRSSITGNFSAAEGTDLANILQTGKLDAPAKIVQEQVVGPTLGQESVDGGITSFAVAFLVIFALMLLYYNTGGIVANIALILNMLFTFGILANMGATLTMAGIAGIVLGIGMAVDTNVLIFERIKEELALGDTYDEAIKKGYKRSLAPVLDGHITSIITAVILYVFGLGPIKGFATTQILALVLSLFTGILVSRLITDAYMKKGRHFNYFTKLSKSIFQKAHFHFIEKRKITYVISAIILVLGAASLFNGFNYGVEFDGGRSYTIKFDKVVHSNDLRDKMHNYLGHHPVVKTIGTTGTQLNLTTDYLITQSGKDVEQQVVGKIYEGLKAQQFIPADVDMATFTSRYIQSGQTDYQPSLKI
jgi:SecD/SecF fusion protein